MQVTAATFSDLCRAKERAQARIGAERRIVLDISVDGHFVCFASRKTTVGLDYQTGALTRDGAIAHLDALA